MKKSALTFALALMVIYLTGQGTWNVIHPELPVRDLLAAQFINEEEGWVVGLDGLIMHTRDGAETWTIQHNQKDESLWSIFFLDDQVGWSVGWNKIYHTTNGGGDWVPQQFPSVMGDLTDVFFINQDTGWIVGTYQIILKTTNGGNSWSLISNSIPDHKAFYRVKFTDALHGVAVGGLFFQPNAFVQVTEDGGLTWTETTPPDADVLQSLYFFDDGLTGWTCGKSGTLLKTNDGGLTWEDKRFENANYKDIHFFDDMHGILLSNSWVRLTNNGGELWEDQFIIGDYYSQNRLTSWDIDKVITVGYTGSINKSTDGGRSWEKINDQFTSSIHDIGFFNGQDGLMLAGSSSAKKMYFSDDGGYSWQPDTLFINDLFYKMQVSGSSCYLLNTSSQLAISHNNGQNWQLFDVPAHLVDYRDMKFVSNAVGYLCGNQGKLVKTTDGGESWTDISLDPAHNFSKLFFVDENIGWTIDVQGKKILRTTNGGNDWTHATLGSTYLHQPVSIFFLNDQDGFSTTAEGMLFKTSNGGITWEEFHDFLSAGYSSKIYFASETEGWYSVGRAIYYTTDGGVAWEQQFFGSASFRCMFFLNSQNAWFAGEKGLIANYRSTVFVDENPDQDKSIKVYPNPATSDLFVSLINSGDEFRNISLFDLKGTKMLEFPNLSLPYSFQLDISPLQTGTYLLKAETAKSMQVIKLLKH
jgi:photosystem II stability/assembly factor-like uncharacterized protein